MAADDDGSVLDMAASPRGGGGEEEAQGTPGAARAVNSRENSCEISRRALRGGRRNGAGWSSLRVKPIGVERKHLLQSGNTD